MKRLMGSLRGRMSAHALLAGAAVASLLPGAARADRTTRGWRAEKAILLPPLRAASPVYLPLDAEALAGMDGPGACEIVDRCRRVTPCLTVEERGLECIHTVVTRTVSATPPFVSPQSLLLEVPRRERGSLVLRLSLSGATTGVTSVVECGDDLSRLAEVGRTSATPLPGGAVDTLRVPLEHDIRGRFLRVTLDPADGAVPRIRWAQLNVETPVRRSVVEVPAAVRVLQLEGGRRTEVQLDPGCVAKDVDELRLEADGPKAERSAWLEVSEGGPAVVCGGAIKLSRPPAGEPIRIDVAALKVRFLRVTIDNGQGGPLSIRKAKLYRFRRGLVFAAQPGQTYALRYGRREGADAHARGPAAGSMHIQPSVLPVASLGPARDLHAGWPEQHPSAVWSGFSVMILGLVTALIRSARTGSGKGRTAPGAMKE